MRLLRADDNLRKAVLRQVRRHLDTGAERPLVDLDFIQSLKGR
jgi:Golgi nucleoside diphosphatase